MVLEIEEQKRVREKRRERKKKKKKKRKEKKKEGKKREDHKYRTVNICMDICLGLYGTISIGIEFEYSFVWKLWEYGSLVLV